MNNDERREMICRLAEQLCGNETKDFSLEAVIKAMLGKNECVKVRTRYMDTTHERYVTNNLDRARYQNCLYEKELFSSQRRFEENMGRYEY